jgi:hypothetical protein
MALSFLGWLHYGSIIFFNLSVGFVSVIYAIKKLRENKKKK